MDAAIQKILKYLKLPQLFLCRRNFYINLFYHLIIPVCFIFSGSSFCLLTVHQNGFTQTIAQNLEYPIKSFLLIKLISYIEWSPEAVADQEFVITVVGENPFGNLLEEQAKKNRYKDKTIVFRHVKQIDEIGHTHVLFIDKALKSEWEKIKEIIKGKPVLTVSEFDGFANQGGIINFIIVDGTVNMEVNLTQAERGAIKISSLVLQLKNKVRIIQE